ncbi:Protein of unknown function [Bacillus mycoides]|nr:Protein of unknown function [Bacillus mycoides]
MLEKHYPPGCRPDFNQHPPDIEFDILVPIVVAG